MPATTANVVARSRPSGAEHVDVAEHADDRPLVGEDVEPGERPHEVGDEERRDDDEQEQVPPRPGPERDPVGERVREHEARDGRDARVHERADQLLVVVPDPVREVRELPRELEVGEEPGLQRLVAEEREGDDEEDPEPEDPRREEQVGASAHDVDGGSRPRARYFPCTASHFLL